MTEKTATKEAERRIKAMSMVQLVYTVLIVAVIGVTLIGLAYWYLETKSDGPMRFRSVKVGAYFDINDASLNSARRVVCQKVGPSHYTSLSGKEGGERVRANGSMAVYNVEKP